MGTMITTKKELDDKDKKIIQLMIRKVSYPKMTRLVFLSENGIRTRLKVMRNYYKCESNQQLISYLIDNGHI